MASLNGKYDMAAVVINAIYLSRWPDGKEGPKNVNKINEKWGYSFENEFMHFKAK